MSLKCHLPVIIYQLNSPRQPHVIDGLSSGDRLVGLGDVGGVGPDVVPDHELGEPLILDRVHLVTHHAQNVEPGEGEGRA